MAETILFANNTHAKGINIVNVTVRNGEKWKELLHPGDTVLLENLDHTDTKEAFVVFLHICKLLDVPREILEMEHDEKCRTFQGLQTTLKEIYGDNIHLASNVTIIGYELQ